MKKKLTALALCASMIAVMAIGTTLAYFTDFDQNTNEFTVGSVKIDLYEDIEHTDGAGKPKNGVSGEEYEELGKGSKKNPIDEEKSLYKEVMPGDTMKKVVTVENTGASTAYVALTIKNENYYNFNQNIDEYYEALYELANSTPTAEQKEAQASAKVIVDGIINNDSNITDMDTFMQKITDDIWSGDDWNLIYAKDVSNGNVDVRYKMENVNKTAEDTADIIGLGYANSTYSNGGPAFNYVGSIFKNQLGAKAPDMDGNFDTLTKDPHTRMWVIYLKMDAGEKITLDLTTTCPTYIDANSIKAFADMENNIHMTLDVKAFAIQASGFETDEVNGIKNAFAELFKAEDCFNY